MEIKEKNIILISPEPWNHIFVSKHHYATHLAKRGNKVFFLNPPSKSLQIEETNIENLYSVHYNGFVKGLRFFPRILRNYLLRKKFEQLQKVCNTEFDIVWSFDNSVFFDFSALPKKAFCISHTVDLNQDFEFEKAAQSADLCLGVSQAIVDKQKQFNGRSFFINHGYNQSAAQFNEDLVLPGKQSIKAFYAGNLNIRYLDWELIQTSIEEFPQVDFIFAGPWDEGAQKTDIIAKHNFHYIGVLAAKDLRSFYEISDLLLITYKYALYPEQLSNSHKMMEYLGSGKMILATWTKEYESLAEEDLIKMAKNTEEFLILFQEVIADLDKWNSKHKSGVRVKIAAKNSYINQLRKIEETTKNI
ncbi:hypothetical protein [uncultured Marivirga sp.]|uniref:glycosyltransferase family protein n=1 Tax=uncultured Marivirga sp. TaxID=1123707 RepID=UPI0030ECD696